MQTQPRARDTPRRIRNRLRQRVSAGSARPALVGKRPRENPIARARRIWHPDQTHVLIAIAISFFLIVVLGVPFTLWWWKLADRWADSEHKRFKEKPEQREEVVIPGTQDQEPPTLP